MPSFDWDRAKARRNIKRQKVTFDGATGVFDDPFALDEIDERQDYDEERSNILSALNKILCRSSSGLLNLTFG
jgi:hypothetical protein